MAILVETEVWVAKLGLAYIYFGWLSKEFLQTPCKYTIDFISFQADNRETNRSFIWNYPVSKLIN